MLKLEMYRKVTEKSNNTANKTIVGMVRWCIQIGICHPLLYAHYCLVEIVSCDMYANVLGSVQGFFFFNSEYLVIESHRLLRISSYFISV